MSGRSFSRTDRAKACWQGQSEERSIVTAARREQMRQMALEDQEEFVRCLCFARFVSLCQLPWWPEFMDQNPWEAAQIVLIAKDKGIGNR